MEKKLTPEHIASYLPYGLKFQDQRDGKIKELCGINTVHFMAKAPFYVTEYRDGLPFSGDESLEMLGLPILRPMTDLANPCLKNDQVPIAHLAMIAESQHFPNECSVKYSKKANVSYCDFKSKETGERIIFSYIHDQNAFYLRSEKRGDALAMVNQFQLFQFLFKHHFDVFGLIKQGLAIDINTLYL